MSGLLVGKVEEDEGVRRLRGMGVDQMYLAKMVNHFSKTLVDPG